MAVIMVIETAGLRGSLHLSFSLFLSMAFCLWITLFLTPKNALWGHTDPNTSTELEFKKIMT